MRERGGRVVLLMDRRAAGPIDRLTGAAQLACGSAASSRKPPDDASADSRFPIPALTARRSPGRPRYQSAHRCTGVSIARDSTRRAVMWSVPVGAGALFVSGALDAWHYRDTASGFDPFWTNNNRGVDRERSARGRSHAHEAVRSPRGRRTNVRVWIRDAALSRRGDRSATVSATAGWRERHHDRCGCGRTSRRERSAESIVGTRAPGIYRIIASSGTERTRPSLIVDHAARAPARDERHLMAAFATSRKGRVIPEAELRDLPRALSSALQSVSRVETWHPMRTAWWIVPFALLLGAEWWWRRRRGLA